MSVKNDTVLTHYDAAAKDYHKHYDREHFYDLSTKYPSNYFRLQLLINSFINKGINKVIEIGVGEGTPIKTLAQTGIDVWGFDISKEMVKKAKENVRKSNMNEDQIFWGDIQDPVTYSHALKDGKFDGAIAMGVMPHVENDEMVLKNISCLVRTGGSVFIEFRNKLFSLFTFNRHTADFILNDLLKGVSDEIKNSVKNDLEKRLRMDMPPVRDKLADSDKPGYDAILSKFHNPFEVIEQFKKLNFSEIRLLWYHYHPSMPYLESEMTDLFRKEAIRLEHDPSDWRGYFLCSAFVVEAVKK